MFKNMSTTYVIKNLINVTVSGPYPDKQFTINEANKWFALYKENVKVEDTKTKEIIYEINN